MGGGVLSRWALSALVLLATSCSVISSRPPPSGPEARTAKAAARCGGIWYPLIDTVSVAGGVTWVVRANNLDEASRTRVYTVAPDGTMTLQSVSAPTSSHDLERYFGYGVIGVFGASALYGFFIEAMCASYRHEIAGRTQNPAESVVPARRVEPPTTVLGFAYNMTLASAEQACKAKQQSWQLTGSTAECAPGAKPDAKLVRLEFQAGALDKIAVVHVSTPDQLPNVYDQLFSALRAVYGEPQLARAAYSEACSKSLADCLKNGEKPRGPSWHFATGSIALQPVWQNDHVVLEERYAHQESMTP